MQHYPFSYECSAEFIFGGLGKKQSCASFEARICAAAVQCDQMAVLFFQYWAI